MAIDCISNHGLFIYDKGGSRRLWQVKKAHTIRWNRQRDDISDAMVAFTKDQCIDQADQLGDLEPMRHELVIFRNGARVWEGPITLTTERRNGMVIEAKDVLQYAWVTAMHAAYSNAYPNVGSVVARAKAILVAELARKEALDPAINVVPHIVDHNMPTDAKTAAVTRKYQYRVQEHLDNLAATAGLDYTVLGRAIHLWDTHQPLGYGPALTEQDFLDDVIVSRYGSQLATRAIVTDGMGNYGIAGGTDPYYGEVEHLATAYDETDGGTPPTSSEMASQAQRNLTDRNPVPVVVRIPDGATLNHNTAVDFDQLVPGTYFPLRARMLTRTYEQMQKLDRVVIEETPQKESVRITLSPANEEAA